MFLIKDSPSTPYEDGCDDSGDLEIGIDCSQGVAVVTVMGELDVSNSELLHDTLHNAIDAGNFEVVVNVEQLTFMDSTGLSAIVGAHKRLRATGGVLTVLAPTPFVVRLFQIIDDVPHLMLQNCSHSSGQSGEFQPVTDGPA
jgi:anti-sigma B factor antagonist